MTLQISSSAFQQNQMIPDKYACKGQDINPPLQIDGIPKNAKSLVLLVDDPDAPRGTWVHWVIWNIPASTTTTTMIAENTVPPGATQGLNDFQKQSYGGPCPPSGTHRYFFKVYALDTMLKLDPNSRKGEVEKAMEGHVLDKAELVGLYKK